MRFRNLHMILVWLLVLVSCQEEKETDWSLTLDRNKKDPYGCYIAYHHLSSLFPEAKIKAGRQLMSTIKKTVRSQNGSLSGNICIVVCKSFEVDSAEMELLKEYVRLSNGLIVFAESFSDNVYEHFHAIPDSNYYLSYVQAPADTLGHQELGLTFNDTIHSFVFNGPNVGLHFDEYTASNSDIIAIGYTSRHDTSHTNMLIRYENNGGFMINRAPMALTNYYMLQDTNRQYYEYVLSYFNTYPTSVNWFSYLNKYPNEQSDFNWSDLFQKPALFYAFLILLITILVYVLFASKRQQRKIPVLEPLTNSSLDFVETVGRLYYVKKNNANLAEKMITHYLENIRIRYQVRTNELNAEFAGMLSRKLEKPSDEINAFVSYLNYIRGAEQVTDIDIQHLYQQLKKYT